MKKVIIIIGILIGIVGVCVVAKSQNPNFTNTKMNAGIVTPKLKESKEFYLHVFGFGVVFENEFYLLLHTPNHQAELSFLVPDHLSQQPLFQAVFAGKGLFLTMEVPNVDEEYLRIKALGIPIAIELKNEPWGDRHFAVHDPNGIGIDIVTYSKPSTE